MKKEKLIHSIAVGIALFGALRLLAAYAPFSAFAVSGDEFIEVRAYLDGSALRFSAGCYEVGMNILELQALSIRNGMEKRIDVRPLTHDTINDIVQGFGIRVIGIRIDSYKDEIYRAKTLLQQGNKVLAIDSRPSDAVGIAVRTGAPVFFNRTLLEQNGINNCE